MQSGLGAICIINFILVMSLTFMVFDINSELNKVKNQIKAGAK